MRLSTRVSWPTYWRRQAGSLQRSRCRRRYDPLFLLQSNCQATAPFPAATARSERAAQPCSLTCCSDRHAYVSYVFQNLNAFVMGLAPHPGIRYVFERRPIDTDHEVPARPRENYDLIRSILRNPVEGIVEEHLLWCTWCVERAEQTP
jgi:hypothetical protein